MHSLPSRLNLSFRSLSEPLISPPDGHFVFQRSYCFFPKADVNENPGSTHDNNPELRHIYNKRRNEFHFKKTKHNITYMEEYFCIDFSICSRVSCLRPDCTVVFPVAGVAENFERQVSEKLNST